MKKTYIRWELDMNTVSILVIMTTRSLCFKTERAAYLDSILDIIGPFIRLGRELVRFSTHTLDHVPLSLPSFQWWAGSLVLTNIHSLTRVGIYSLHFTSQKAAK